MARFHRVERHGHDRHREAVEDGMAGLRTADGDAAKGASQVSDTLQEPVDDQQSYFQVGVCYMLHAVR